MKNDDFSDQERVSYRAWLRESELSLPFEDQRRSTGDSRLRGRLRDGFQMLSPEDDYSDCWPEALSVGKRKDAAE